MKYNYIPGLNEADMKKIQGFRLRLVNLLFPSLIEVLRSVSWNKRFYKETRDELETSNAQLFEELRNLKSDLKYIEENRDERLRKAKTNHSIDVNAYQVALQSEQAKNERLKKEIKALHKTIGKLKGQNSNKPKNNEVERSIEVSGN